MTERSDDLSARQPLAVLDDHLRCRAEHDLEADLARNFAPDVRVLSATGVHHGHDGVRECADDLRRYFPDMVFEITRKFVDGDLAYIEWCAEGGNRASDDGADSFVIHDGKIVAQTIHYTVTSEPMTA